MRSKIILLLAVMAFYLIPCSAQTWNEVKSHSAQYLFGEGVGATVEEADQQALADLISKISVAVSSDFTISEDEMTLNGKLDSKSYTNAKVRTYSAATLTNTERIVIESTPDEFRIGRFIKRTELNRIFEGRILSLKEYIRLGRQAESSLKIDDALRSYYWAYALLKSVQHPAEVSYEDEETGESFQPLTWLPERINYILSNLDAKIVGNDGTNVDLSFSYNGKPVTSLDFTYFDGRNWSNISSVKDGVGTMEFGKGMVPQNIQINYEYAYRSQSHINPEIKSVLGVIKGHAMHKARVNLTTNKTAARPSLTTSDKVSFASNEYNDVNSKGDYKNILTAVMTAVRRKQFSGIEQYFTADGIDMFNKLLRYGNARVINDQDCELYNYRDEVVARGIQMSFSFKTGSRQNFVEDIVFTFNSDKKIDCVAFGLGKKAQSDIMSKKVWPLQARQALMEFLENYKTAYALKRLDYLQTIFDDNAVIIVGHVANVMQVNSVRDGVTSISSNQHITRTQYSKDEYMKHLAACFKSNEFINIRFANNDIRKAQRGEEYGIQIKQDYYSSNYGDEGYLYIQVDITNPDEPVIKVRTWQPKPDPEIGLFGIGNW